MLKKQPLFANGKRVHFVGIGGAGMFPMASILAQKGCVVTGSDLEASINTETLKAVYQTSISYGPHDVKNINRLRPPEVIIHTSAAKLDNPEILAGYEHGSLIVRRGEALADLLRDYERVVAVSGSHGKTTITSMIAHLFRQTLPSAGFLVGGKVNGWKIPANCGNGDIFVTEADESDGSHTSLFPYLGVIPNIEDDHAWSTGGKAQLYANFQKFAQQSQKLIYIISETTEKLLAFHSNAKGYTAQELLDPSFFKVLTQEDFKMWPDFQILNAALALLVMDDLGVSREDTEKHILTFPGAMRRMVVHAKREDAVLIEDYAHHPTELKVFLDGLRKIYPEWRIQVVFQPHRYARLQRYIDEFAELLSGVDQVFVTPVFAAWVEQGDVNSALLTQKIGSHAKFIDSNDWKSIAEHINPFISHEKGVVTAVVGAGDIDRVLPFLKVLY